MQRVSYLVIDDPATLDAITAATIARMEGLIGSGAPSAACYTARSGGTANSAWTRSSAAPPASSSQRVSRPSCRGAGTTAASPWPMPSSSHRASALEAAGPVSWSPARVPATLPSSTYWPSRKSHASQEGLWSECRPIATSGSPTGMPCRSAGDRPFRPLHRRCPASNLCLRR
jgi:hypothetical protein